MSNPSREEQLKAHAALSADRFARMSAALAVRQARSGPLRGNVPPWPGSTDLDFGGTLAALWIWRRTHALGVGPDLEGPIEAARALVRGAWDDFIPRALGAAEASDEAAYECALVLRVALADPAEPPTGTPDALPERAARLLAAYLADLEDTSGRGFEDPGFLVTSLADYARAVDDRGTLAVARRFVDRAYGMKAPPPFDSEPAVRGSLPAIDGLFDFSCTTGTRVLATIAALGATPLIGVWLRERVAPLTPRTWSRRPLDEHCWNAGVAAAMGRSFLVSTDDTFLASYQILLGELHQRADAVTATMGRSPEAVNETRATFHYALALDALMRSDSGGARA